jgi:hypothetical protein
MTNVLEAIIRIIEYDNFEIKESQSGRNRMNNMGEALELFIKNAFSDALETYDEFERLKKYNSEFSWTGNQNHPPDIMIKGGDAIEVKKTQSPNSSLALNSSYPKANLSSTSPMITKECRECEDWNTKDIIYCIGHTSDTNLNSLWMVYGDLYAAKHETYQIIKTTIAEGITEIPNVEFSETKELGRINKVDPLGITNLRIRGMWQIENPRRVFSYLNTPTGYEFELVTIIKTSKYNSFADDSKISLMSLEHENFCVSDVKVKDPNNPVKFIDCKLITYFK